ncbi:MAG: Holliday junction branch migration protein RuvA [Syntrophorhabdaceae bacterium]|nr:Holliday junction branch migration protein RuvA [Syntrophorhabdaceae bacterium]
MIDHLKGHLTGSGKDFVVVECGGIGFRAYVSSATRSALPAEGESCFLRTYLHFREGGGDLFGFSSEAERDIFLATIGVSGVGPKSALAVLSVLGVDGVLAGCAREDAAVFTQVPGIGKKLAQRIAMELPDRLKKISEFSLTGDAGGGGTSRLNEEAFVALSSLGFSRDEARLAIEAARREMGAEISAEAMLREALKRLSGSRR